MRGWLCVTSIVIFITFATRSASCQKDNICQKLLTSFFFNPKGTWVMTKNRKLRLKMSHSKHCLTANFRFFKNPPKVTIFGIFNELLSNQNVNVAHFARNVEWDFSVISNTVGANSEIQKFAKILFFDFAICFRFFPSKYSYW